jgi:predicted permease
MVRQLGEAMNTFLQDLRYAVRMLAKPPSFAVIAILTLALGIGANTALFSVVNAVLLNPLPYAQPSRLVALYSRSPEFPHSSISYPNFLDWVRDNRSFSSLAAFRQDNFNLTGMGEPERVRVEMVSASFFPLLGVNPVLGRAFLSGEDQVGAAPVALLSGGFWESKFGAAPDIIGRNITLNGKSYTIVGVIPPGFRYHSGNFQESDFYVPIGQWNDSTFRDRRAAMGMDAVGRLNPGVTFEQAKADMDGVGRRLSEAFPEADKDTGIALSPLKQDVIGDIRPYLLVLLAAVGFVLLIACANLANLLLARSTGRTREFAIRTALGASQARVVRQLLTESILLALAGGALGLLLAAFGTQAALKLLPEALPRAEEIHLDGRVLFFTFLVSLLSGVLFGLVPAFKTSRADLHETLKEGGRGMSGTRHRTQRIFVAVELALALVLLTGAGLMLRSLGKLWNVNPGFDPHSVVNFNLSYPPTMAATPDANRALFREFHDRIASLPGVVGASVTVGAVPMSGDSELNLWLEGEPKPASQSQMKVALFYAVQPDYLKILRIPLERGRFLTAEDNEHSHFVIVIDDQFAKLYFPGQDPVGRRVNLDLVDTAAEIVGVVGHVKQWGLDSDGQSPVQAQFYFPVSQIPDKFMTLLAGGVGFFVRTSGSPLAEMNSIRHAVNEVNGQVVVFGMESMDGIISDSLASQRFVMILLGIFAGLALLLSCVGIYGVVSYLVAQRTHETGVRMALGARPGDVMRLFLGQAARMALIGIAAGLVAALALTRLMSKLLFGVSAHDPLTLLGVAAILVIVALAACYVPALRATRVDPTTALRYE